jgi:hypothetical protein
MRKNVCFLVLFSLALSLASLTAFELTYEGIDGEMGFLWKNNDGYDKEKGDSGPDTLTFIPGVSVFFSVDENWFFRPSLFFYNQTLEYLPERDYTIPVDYSNIKSMTVTSLFIQPAAGYRWTFKERHTLGVQAAPAINIQVPVTGPGDEDRGDMFSALMREFLYLNLGVWYYNPLTERFGFNFKLELNLPVYNAWAGTGLPFSDGLMVNFLVGIRVLAQ